MDIIDANVTHHKVLRQLYIKSENDLTLFDELFRHLVIHHTTEEKYFYDLLETIPETLHDALEAVNEHHIEMIIKDSEGFPCDHEHFPIKIGAWENTQFIISMRRKMIFSWQPGNCSPARISHFSGGNLMRQKAPI